MINRESNKVKVLTYTDTVDSYGRKRQGVASTRYVDMFVKVYNQRNVNNPNYVDVEMIGLTKDTGITELNQIEYNNIKYNVLYVIPSRRYTQVLMKKV